MNTNIILGSIATMISIAGFVPYYKDIFAGKPKPHTFSWLVWSLITGISFFAQLADNAGPGAWVMGFVAMGCFGIFVLSLTRGEKNIVAIDYISLCIALIALASWILTKTPLYAVILVTITDAFAFIPTMRKSYYKPYDETMVAYFAGGVQFIFALFALEKVSIITTLYPAFLIFANLLFVGMLIIRRRVIPAK